jgi:hypothetical protein
VTFILSGALVLVRSVLKLDGADSILLYAAFHLVPLSHPLLHFDPGHMNMAVRGALIEIHLEEE